jgi:hypothetical protein
LTTSVTVCVHGWYGAAAGLQEDLREVQRLKPGAPGAALTWPGSRAARG